MFYRFDSPFGVISYQWDGRACRRVWLQRMSEAVEEHDDPVSCWLHAYIARQAGTLPRLIAPATRFQKTLRAGLATVPAGEVRSYGELAGQLHTSPRALGQALGANPLPLLVPCHRIVAANGLGGFACGLDWKRQLLAFEGWSGAE